MRSVTGVKQDHHRCADGRGQQQCRGSGGYSGGGILHPLTSILPAKLSATCRCWQSHPIGHISTSSLINQTSDITSFLIRGIVPRSCKKPPSPNKTVFPSTAPSCVPKRKSGEYGEKRYHKKTPPASFCHMLPALMALMVADARLGTGWIVSMRHGDDAAGGLLECE